jgi:hypothetical protein
MSSTSFKPQALKLFVLAQATSFYTLLVSLKPRVANTFLSRKPRSAHSYQLMDKSIMPFRHRGQRLALNIEIAASWLLAMTRRIMVFARDAKIKFNFILNAVI